MEARQSSPSKIDLWKVTVDDPNLLDYPELVTKYTPKTLLEKYESTVKRGKLKIVRTLSENWEHVWTIKFHTEEKSLEAKETHATNSMYATHFACQKMLRQLFPHQWIWVNLVNYIDSLPVIEVYLFSIFILETINYSIIPKANRISRANKANKSWSNSFIKSEQTSKRSIRRWWYSNWKLW